MTSFAEASDDKVPITMVTGSVRRGSPGPLARPVRDRLSPTVLPFEGGVVTAPQVAVVPADGEEDVGLDDPLPEALHQLASDQSECLGPRRPERRYGPHQEFGIMASVGVGEEQHLPFRLS